MKDRVLQRIKAQLERIRGPSMNLELFDEFLRRQGPTTTNARYIDSACGSVKTGRVLHDYKRFVEVAEFISTLQEEVI